MKKRNITDKPNSKIGVEIEDSIKEDMFENYVIGVICLAAAGAIFHYGQPLTLQFSSPDFNPLVIMIIAVLGYAGFSFYRAVRRTIHHRLYGTSSLALDAPPQLGTSLSGEIRTAMALLPSNKVHYRLRCVERYTPKSYGSSLHSNSEVDDVLWETREMREGLTTTRETGIPINLFLPEDAVPKRKDTINPNEIRWILDVTVEGTPYSAVFGFRVAPAARVKPRKKKQKEIERLF